MHGNFRVDKTSIEGCDTLFGSRTVVHPRIVHIGFKYFLRGDNGNSTRLR